MLLTGRIHKELCIEDAPIFMEGHREAHVHQARAKSGDGKMKLRRLIGQEIPYKKVPFHERPL